MKFELPDFAAVKVLVVGDLMLDRYWLGPTSRVSPEAPVPVVKIEKNDVRAGGAGNVALNLAELGCQAELLSATGQDAEADMLQAHLSQRKVACHFIPVVESSTVTKLRVVSRNQQLLRCDFEDGFAQLDFEILVEAFARLITEVDAVILSDYGKGTLRDPQRLIGLARAAHKPVLVDPKGSDFSRYAGATLITPNVAELEAVVGACVDESCIERKGGQLIQDCELDALLVTRSEKGMTLLRDSREALHLPTHAREVYDVTGAGDTVISTLAAGLAAGMTFPEAVAMANLAAGVVVGKLGTASVSLQELQDAMLWHQPLQRGMVEVAYLIDLVQKARENGERIVMTNGCFDLLHPGHVDYLAKARSLGDRLIVAVNSDDSVKRLKGPSRPINSLEHRMIILEALEAVDWVVAFDTDTPRDLICAVGPDVLVKGGDYRPEDIAGGDCVRARGGDVVVLPFVDGCSTTGIIDKIQQR